MYTNTDMYRYFTYHASFYYERNSYWLCAHPRILPAKHECGFPLTTTFRSHWLAELQPRVANCVPMGPGCAAVQPATGMSSAPIWISRVYYIPRMWTKFRAWQSDNCSVDKGEARSVLELYRTPEHRVPKPGLQHHTITQSIGTETWVPTPL